MARDPSLLSSHSPVSIAPANPYIVHVQLRDLLICPRHQGVVNYVADHAIVEQDLHAKGAPYRILSGLKFAANSITSLPINENDTLIAAGGQEAELHLSCISSPSSTQASSSSSHSAVTSTSSSTQGRRSRVQWDYSTRLTGTINNSVLLTSLSLTTSHLSSVEPRVGISNNDGSVRLYDVPMRVQNATRNAHGLPQVGVVKLDVPINHSSISPDGRTLLSVGDSSKVYFHRISGSSSHLTFAPITTLSIPSPDLSSLQYNYANYPNSLTAAFSTAFSHDGSKFAVASQEGVVAVWDVRLTSKPLRIFHSDRERGPGSEYERMMNLIPGINANGAASGWLSDDPWEWTRGTRAPGWCVRSVKFNSVSPRASGPGLGGFGGREIMAFTEHTDLVHVVDARTFETAEVVRVPMISRKGKHYGRMRMDSGGRKRRRRTDAPAGGSRMGEGSSTRPEASTSVAGASTITASDTSTAARLRRMERLADRRGLVSDLSTPPSIPGAFRSHSASGAGPAFPLNLPSTSSAAGPSRPSISHLRSRSDVGSSLPSTRPSAPLAEQQGSSSSFNRPITPPARPTPTRPTSVSPPSPGAYSAPASIGDSTWRTLDDGIPIAVGATAIRDDLDLREPGLELGSAEEARPEAGMDTEMDTPTTIPSLHALARYVLDDDEADTAASTVGTSAPRDLDSETIPDWREILAATDRALRRRADDSLAGQNVAGSIEPSVTRRRPRPRASVQDDGSGGEGPGERETEPIADRMRRIRMQERALMSGLPLNEPVAGPSSSASSRVPGTMPGFTQRPAMGFTGRSSSPSAGSTTTQRSVQPVQPPESLHGFQPLDPEAMERAMRIWGPMFTENLRLTRQIEAEGRARAERGEGIFDINGNIRPEYQANPELIPAAHGFVDADDTDSESEDDEVEIVGRDRNTGSTAGDYNYPLYASRRGSSVSIGSNRNPGQFGGPARYSTVRSRWIPGRREPNPARLDEEDEEEATRDEHTAHEDAMVVDENDTEDGDGTDRPITSLLRRRRHRGRAVTGGVADPGERDDISLDLLDDLSSDDSIDYDDDEDYDGWYSDGDYYSSSAYHASSSPSSPATPHTSPMQPNLMCPEDLDIAGVCFDPWGEMMYVAGVKSTFMHPHPLHSPRSSLGGYESPDMGATGPGGVRTAAGISGPGVGHSSLGSTMVFMPPSPLSSSSAGYERAHIGAMGRGYSGIGGIGIGGTGDMGLGPGVVVEWGVRGAEKRFWVDEGWM